MEAIIVRPRTANNFAFNALANHATVVVQRIKASDMLCSEEQPGAITKVEPSAAVTILPDTDSPETQDRNCNLQPASVPRPAPEIGGPKKRKQKG